MPATRVRVHRFLRKPVPTPHWTPGDHQPTALALAATGLLSQVADKMGRHVSTLEKWAQGERGPEPDLRDLFLALHEVGVPRERATLLITRIKALFDSVYAGNLPTLTELHRPETAIDHAEDETQMDCVLADDDLDHQELHLPNVLAEIAILQTIAARITRNLHAAGRL